MSFCFDADTTNIGGPFVRNIPYHTVLHRLSRFDESQNVTLTRIVFFLHENVFQTGSK